MSPSAFGHCPPTVLPAHNCVMEEIWGGRLVEEARVIEKTDKPSNTATKGEITESIVLAKLVQLGYKCLIPWGHDHRYDIAIDSDGKLICVQCKTARYIEEWKCIEFNTAITYAKVGGKPHIRKGYKDEADYFGVYSPDTGKVYLISVDDLPMCSKGRLRLEATKNNQAKGVRWAKDYEI